jgi:TonB-dependent receptor
VRSSGPHGRVWRKAQTESSSGSASRKIAPEGHEKALIQWLAVGFLLAQPSLAWTQSRRFDDVIAFDIPRQRADLALTRFAEQADVTLIFPYDKVSGITANSLVGEYSIEEALQRLLSNTQLQTAVSDRGQLSIVLKEPEGETGAVQKRNKVSHAIMGILASVVGAREAAAQDAEPGVLEEVTVTGIRASMTRSMDIKRDAGGVVDAISAEDIGKFPDTNLAESLQRISGVSIDRSGGEGQAITVRGFGPEFNTVLVNGRQIASEDLSRGFSFDTLASELVSGIVVHKTSTAAMQSGGVGSTVNITTARPLDLGGFKVAGSVKALYDENSERTTPQASVLISDTFAEDTFGVLLALSHQKRETRLNQAQTDGWLENPDIPVSEINGGAGTSGNIFLPRNYDHKVTFEERTRTGGSLVLQYAPTERFTFTADALYSDFDIETNATSFGHWFTAPNVRDVVTDENGTVVDLYQEIGLATDMHAKKFDRLTETSAYGFNLGWKVNDSLNVSFDASLSNAEREANNGGGDQLSLIGYANRVRFQVMPGETLPYASGFESANPNIYSGQQVIDGVAYNPAVTPVGVSDYLDTSNSRAHVMLRRGWAVDDDVDQFRVDGVWDEKADAGLSRARFGALLSKETKALARWDNEGVGIHCTFCGYPDNPLQQTNQWVFDAGDDFLSGVSGHGRMPHKWLAHDGEAQFAYLESISGLNFDAVMRDNSFVVDEDTQAVYLDVEFAGTIAGMPISAITGARYETTDVTVNGRQAPVIRLDILDQTEMLAAFGDSTDVSEETDYSALLPSISVKLDISDDLVARFAVSQTITRPTLENMAPITTIVTTRQGGNLAATSGNPALEPFESNNIDLSLEYYYARASYVAAGYFQKDVDNFIVTGTEDRTFELPGGGVLLDPSTGTDPRAPDAADTPAVFTVTLPSNGETAKVSGFELSALHSFGTSGFGLMANATFVDSDADLNVADITQTFAVTGLSDSLNAVAFYEKGPYQIRLAYNQRDEFLQRLTQTNGDGVVFVDDYYQWDISGSYDFSKNLSIFFEGLNLTEEVVTKHGRFGNHFLLAEDSGRRFAIGVRGSF